MQVRHEISNFLIIQRGVETRHVAAATDNDLARAVVIGGETAGQIFLAEDSSQSRSLPWLLGKGVMARDATGIVDHLAALLLRVKRRPVGDGRRVAPRAKNRKQQRGSGKKNNGSAGAQSTGFLKYGQMFIMVVGQSFCKTPGAR